MKTALIIVLIIAALGLAGGDFIYTASLKSDYTATVEALAVRADTLGDRLTSLEGNIEDLAARPIPTQFDPSGLQADIDAAASGLAALQDTLSGTESEVADIAAQLDAMDSRITAAEAVVQAAGLDAAEVYDKVTDGVVRITNGQSVVGSGFIYSADGLVLTANHVIESLSPIYVLTHDGHASRATVVGTSVPSDVAVLRMVNNPGLAPLPLAEAGSAQPGDAVVAIGSPGEEGGEHVLGFVDTVTVGVVSQVNRYVTVETNSVSNLIQFDAAVNPGNSGGPLFDAEGNVAGIIIARVPSGVGDGISWAVDAGKVKKVAEEIIATGSYRYPYLGINIDDIDPLTAEDLGLDLARGVLVTGVLSGGPAGQGGLRVDDVIVSLGGRTVRDLDELVSFLALYHSPGDVVGLEVIRGSITQTLTVTVGERP